MSSINYYPSHKYQTEFQCSAEASVHDSTASIGLRLSSYRIQKTSGGTDDYTGIGVDNPTFESFEKCTHGAKNMIRERKEK